MRFSDKLNLLMADKGISQAQFADALHMPRQTIQVWASGRSRPRGTNLARICQFFGVEPAWFESDSDTIENTDTVKTFVPGEEMPPQGFVAIPEYRLTFSAGGGAEDPEWEEENCSQPAWYRDDYFRSRGLDSSKCRRSKVIGDSMEPELCDGDTIMWVAEKHPQIYDGAIYVIWSNGMKIKKLQRIKNGLRIISINPSYSAEEYVGEEADNIQIYGRVIELNRSL